MEESEHASEQLMFVSGYVYRLLIREARRIGIRWRAILVLKDLDLLGPLSQQTLADIEQVKRPTMTVLLQQMETEGWITRTVDPQNRSANVVSITPPGRRTLRRAGKALRTRIQAAIGEMSQRELSEIDCALTLLTAYWMQGIEQGKQSR
jgi:DNA-binding MarR family transcriptional regulator